MNDDWLFLKKYGYHIKIVQSNPHETSSLMEGYIKELPDVAEFSDSWKDVYELLVDTIETYEHWRNNNNE